MNEKLYNFLLDLPKENLVHLMWAALDEMQSYNGKSRTKCILMAMGAEERDNGTWKLPELEEILENTKELGL